MLTSKSLLDDNSAGIITWWCYGAGKIPQRDSNNRAQTKGVNSAGKFKGFFIFSDHN